MNKEINKKATEMGLREIEKNGSDMEKYMEMDFFISVKSESCGLQVAEVVKGLGFEVAVKGDGDNKWTCYCTKSIVPYFDRVFGIEKELNEVAFEYGGYSDGFGSFGNDG